MRKCFININRFFFFYFKLTKLKKEISLSILFYIESIILIQYATEFILRLFSCGCKAKFHGFKGRFRFMRQFFPLLGKYNRPAIGMKDNLLLRFDNIDRNCSDSLPIFINAKQGKSSPSCFSSPSTPCITISSSRSNDSR